MLYNPLSIESLVSKVENPLKMKLLVVLFFVAMIVLPTEGLFRRRRRWIRIRAGKVLTGLGVAAKLGLIGKRDVQDDLAPADLNEDGNIDQSEAENLFDERDAEEILKMADMDGDSVVSHDEFIRGLKQLFSHDAE
ncbi:uncharacterized protein [Haliotis asinina]|uniref:uncharacterized protein n=1 Tax=Haliotis asinina TaxID=109174 RepID=UPI003532692B